MSPPLVAYDSVAADADQAAHNHAWMVSADGQVFARRNPPDAFRPQGADRYWYAQPWPDAPSHTLSQQQLDDLRRHLGELLDQPPPASAGRPEDTEHGGWDRLQLRLGERAQVIELHSSREATMRALIRPILQLIRKP